MPDPKRGRWRCFVCDGPDAPWRTSPAPRQAAAYHRIRYHRPIGARP